MKARIIVTIVGLVASIISVGLFLAVERIALHRALTFAYIDAEIATANIPHTAQLPSKTVPLFYKTGGLVVFLHVAKTGGTSIRDNFGLRKKEFPNVKVRRILVEAKLKEIREEVDFYVSSANTGNKTLILETHGGLGQPMSIFQLHAYVHEWRSMAKANEKNVFFFTILREPSLFYVSYFNFFKHPGCDDFWCDSPVRNLTERNLIESLIPNHQCLYLARKQNNRAVNLEFPVTALECESVYSLLKADVDWVGTTDTMVDTTLPLLSYMLAGDAEIGRSFEASNTIENQKIVENPLKIGALSAGALQQIREASKLDRYLYDSAARDYQMGVWKNFHGL